METVTLKMEKRQVQFLEELARRRGCSKAAVMRELVEKQLRGGSARSLHERAKDLCGYFAGPGDLSTRTPKGYGRD